MQKQQGIEPGCNIIEHDTQAAMDMRIKPAHREWFQYIKKTEEDKTKNYKQGMKWDGSQGNHLADDLINDNKSGVRAVNNFFCSACGNGTDDEESCDDQAVMGKGKTMEKNQRRTPTREPQVPGALGKYPLPPPVAMAI